MSDNEKEESNRVEKIILQAIKEIQGKVEQFKTDDNENVNLFEINELHDKISKTKWKLENVDYQHLKRSSVLVYDKKLKELLKEVESLKYVLVQKENKKECEAANNSSINIDEDFFLIPDNVGINEESDANPVSENEADLSQHKLSFQNLKNHRIIKGIDDTEYSSLKLDNLDHCEVFFFNILSSVLIQRIENCTLWLAAVESSVLIYNCINCNILTNTKQLRIHDTVGTNFYITTASHPIIENSSDLSFSRYNLNFDGLFELLQKIGLHKNSDKWKNILDFNWQNAEKPSPNFRICNETETMNVIIKKKGDHEKEALVFDNQYDIENFPSFLKKIE